MRQRLVRRAASYSTRCATNVRHCEPTGRSLSFSRPPFERRKRGPLRRLCPSMVWISCPRCYASFAKRRGLDLPQSVELPLTRGPRTRCSTPSGWASSSAASSTPRLRGGWNPAHREPRCSSSIPASTHSIFALPLTIPARSKAAFPCRSCWITGCTLGTCVQWTGHRCEFPTLVCCRCSIGSLP